MDYTDSNKWFINGQEVLLFKHRHPHGAIWQINLYQHEAKKRENFDEKRRYQSGYHEYVEQWSYVTIDQEGLQWTTGELRFESQDQAYSAAMTQINNLDYLRYGSFPGVDNGSLNFWYDLSIEQRAVYVTNFPQVKEELSEDEQWEEAVKYWANMSPQHKQSWAHHLRQPEDDIDQIDP